MNFLVKLAFTISLLLSTNCWSESDFIVARINQKTITNSELSERYNFLQKTAKISLKSQQDRSALLDQILNKMVDEEVIRQAAKNFHIEVNKQEVEEAAYEIAAEKNQTAQQLKNFLKSNNLSLEKHLEQIEAEMLWSRIVNEVIRPRVKATEIEVKELFEQQKIETKFKQFLLAEIFVNNTLPNAEELAKKLTKELKKGADFKALSQQFSSTIGDKNGEIGWVSKHDVDAKIYDKISHLEKSQYSEPVLLNDGYHIFKVLNTKTETKISENDFKHAQEIVVMRKLQAIAQGFLLDLRKKAFVEMKLR